MQTLKAELKHSNIPAVSRWAAIGPYYAMFPLDFAFKVVAKYSKPGDSVIDPFAGRASSIYAAATQKRYGFGIEINPVGWLYAQTKLNPAPLPLVEDRLADIVKMAKSRYYLSKAKRMPEFFQWCYSQKVLAFLLAARHSLEWEENQVDSTLMTFFIIYLHGKLGEGLSNQMRQTKAMGVEYSIRWWKEHSSQPPEIDYQEFFLKRIRWRYAKGIPDMLESQVELGDSTEVLDKVVSEVQTGLRKPYSLLFTSPPYYKITNYHADQWLRLWMLGGAEKPVTLNHQYKGKFNSQKVYTQLLDSVFQKCARIMTNKGNIYIRTDAREFTFQTTWEILRKYFPSTCWKEQIIPSPTLGRRTQTILFGDKEKKPGEVDVILTRKKIVRVQAKQKS